MAKLPTYTLKHKTTGAIRTVNCFDYNRNLAKWRNWRRIGENNQQADKADVKQAVAEVDGELFRRHKPGHISGKDPERAAQGRAITVSPDTRKNLAEQAEAVDQ